MADNQASSSDESMEKDWTLVDQEGISQVDNDKSSSSSSLSGVDFAPEVSQESIVESERETKPAIEGTTMDAENVLVSDSDVDFVGIDEETDDHVDDWVSATFANRHRESLLENSRIRCDADDREDLTSDCTEVDSDEEKSSVSDAEEDDDESGSETDSSTPAEAEIALSRNEDFRLPLDVLARNTNANDTFSVVLIVALAVVSGLAVGHFVGSGYSGMSHETPRPMDNQQHFEYASTLALSDVQKGQVEILKQLQEMIHLQGDLKQRIASLEDENRDLRLRLVESRKRCTRILHKNPLTFIPSSEGNLNLNFSDDGLERIHLDLTFPVGSEPSAFVGSEPSAFVGGEINPSQRNQVAQNVGALQLTIAAVIVPPRHSPDLSASTHFPNSQLLQTVMPATSMEEANFVVSPIQKYEPFFYPTVNFDEVSKKDAPIGISEDLDYFTALEELVSRRKQAAIPPAAPSSAATEMPKRVANFDDKTSFSVFANESSGKIFHEKVGGKQKKTVKDDQPVISIKKEIKNEKDKIKENRKKFEEDYAEFKARWKNISAAEAAGQEKLKETKQEKCSKGKDDRDCDNGYCYSKPNKSGKYEKKERNSGKKFWDSLPPIFKKHFSKSAKIEKILRGFGTDIVQSKVFQKVVEEVPKRLKMSSEWWGCQWNWWQNYARNKHVSSYNDCAGYLTSWQNRQRQASMYHSKEECKAPVKEKQKAKMWDDEVDEEEEAWETDSELLENWFVRRAAFREEQRSPNDWSFSRAIARDRLRVIDKYPDIHRAGNTSWWFFQRARDRKERRFNAFRNSDHNSISNAIPADPIYSFLKHRAMWHGSSLHHP
jgi:hypothetical protein